jgi:hypothetical protein
MINKPHFQSKPRLYSHHKHDNIKCISANILRDFFIIPVYLQSVHVRYEVLTPVHTKIYRSVVRWKSTDFFRRNTLPRLRLPLPPASKVLIIIRWKCIRRCSEMSVDFRRTTRRYIPEDELLILRTVLLKPTPPLISAAILYLTLISQNLRYVNTSKWASP